MDYMKEHSVKMNLTFKIINFLGTQIEDIEKDTILDEEWINENYHKFVLCEKKNVEKFIIKREQYG